MRKYTMIMAVVLMTSAAWGQTKESFRPSFTATAKTTHEIAQDQAYTFGYLEVPENRTHPSGGTIKLPVYIFKSRSAQPKPDPIIYTVGGPGSTTMPSAQYMDYYQYLDDRDFILIEQRGNFFAKPHLDCPEWSKAVYLAQLPDCNKSTADSLLLEAAKNCKERLTSKGIDLNSYNTNAIAADIADLVKVLEIDSFNLLTISYSTKIAQVLVRDYPKGIRSVVMDSPLPLEARYDEESVSNLLRAVDQLLSDCAADSACQQAYPNLKQRFFDYLAEKTQKPLEVTIENPQDGNPETFWLKGKDLITVFTSASTGSVAAVPYEINQLLNNDLSAIKERLTYLFEEPGGAGIGMRLSVWCAEEYPFNDQEVINEETFSYPAVAGLSPATYDASICTIWGVKSVAAIENEAVKSDIPVLLISGEYDELTPPQWAANMQANLSNSYHLVFKGWKHTPTTNWGNQCAMQAANDFFNNPRQSPLSECFSAITTPKFKVE
jgi:pimeloyl-ACP methyl ester carboxylesterase